MISEKIGKILILLNGVANDSIDPAQALKEWPDIDSETDDLIAASWHDLSHFANDDDVRLKDKEYDALMRKNLQNRSKEIEVKFED